MAGPVVLRQLVQADTYDFLISLLCLALHFRHLLPFPFDIVPDVCFEILALQLGVLVHCVKHDFLLSAQSDETYLWSHRPREAIQQETESLAKIR